MAVATAMMVRNGHMEMKSEIRNPNAEIETEKTSNTEVSDAANYSAFVVRCSAFDVPNLFSLHKSVPDAADSVQML